MALKTQEEGSAGEDAREALCRSLGIDGVMVAHGLVLAGAKRGAEALLQKGLNAQVLSQLGYAAPAMVRLGYRAPALKQIGYPEYGGAAPSGEARARLSAAPDNTPTSSTSPIGPIGAKSAPSPGAPPKTLNKDPDRVTESDILDLMARGCRAADLKNLGLNVHHCRKAGCDVADLERIGFAMEELARAFTAAQLRGAGYEARDLGSLYSGHDLRAAGFSAVEMRSAGYSIRDLLNFGYNENHVRTAGYSNAELLAEGLSRLTHDKTAVQGW